MRKLLFFGLLCGLAVLAAGIFGALHNQLSYSVGPSYFHDLKFDQFGIAEDQRGRLGASIVGWHASWWMGLIVGLPAFALGLILVRSSEAYLARGIAALFAVILLTFMASFIGLALGLIFVTPDLVDQLTFLPPTAGDNLGFTRAGIMHDMSYLGGLLGTLLALVIMWRGRHAT